MKRLIRTTTISLLFFLLLTQTGESQIIPQLKSSLNASPSSPSPGERVKIEAAAPGFDRDNSFFEWTVNGKLRPDLSGSGKNTIELTAGGLGTSLRVTVEVTSDEKRTTTASLNVGVSDLALSWFSETYIPKWYKGKALPVAGSIVNIVAIPNVVVGGRTVPATNLIYRWSLDDQERVLAGVGKQKLQIRMSDIPQTEHRVEVIVEDLTKTIKKEGTILISSVSPLPVLYPYSQSGGVAFYSAPPLFSAGRGELLDFIVEPFFFPVLRKSELGYGWNVSGSVITGDPQNPHFLTVDTGTQASTLVPISITVTPPQTTPLAPVTRTQRLLIQ